MAKTYRVAKNGPTLHEAGQVCRPGQEIELEESRALAIGDSLERDETGKPLVVRGGEPEKKDEEVGAKAVEAAPKDKQHRRGRSREVRK